MAPLRVKRRDDGLVSSSVASPSRPQHSPAPCLLPAFEPISSSPLPRPQKRKHQEDSPLDAAAGLKHYPTPVPTSSTGVLPSTPAHPVCRPHLVRTLSGLSTLSERAPLGDVPIATLPLNGEPLLLGRSSNSSNYQFAANRLISRVHVRAMYIPPGSTNTSGTVKIECLGWNGVKVHCRGKIYPLGKTDVFTSDMPDAQIMLDVHEARVMIAWPDGVRRSVSSQSDRTWAEGLSPSRCSHDADGGLGLASSPPLMLPRSPVSPTPMNQSILSASQTFIANVDPNSSTTEGPVVQVYEDPNSDSEPVPEDGMPSSLSPNASRSRRSALGPKTSRSSPLPSDDFSDQDEENDPVVHAFGPFGENILPRLESITASPTSAAVERRRKPLRATSHSPQKSETTRRGSSFGIGISLGMSDPMPTSSSSEAVQNDDLIRNHIINQLAFSRVHAIPLSTLLGNLPASLKGRASASSSNDDDCSDALTGPVLRDILDSIACVGEISREGKDAAGKQLENEYYYVPEMDDDKERQKVVEESRGHTGLRAARKQHKQYYWKRPRH